MPHRRFSFRMVLPVLVTVVALALAGCQFSYTSYTIDCMSLVVYGLTAKATVANFDSDFDGIADSAEFTLTATDGAGNTLIPPLPPGTFLVPVSMPFGPGDVGVPFINPPQYNPITVTVTMPSNSFLASDVLIASFIGQCPGLPAWVDGLGDGRINRFDMAAPVAVYPFTFEGGVGLRFYQIDAGGHGALILEVTPEQIAAVANPPAANTLIASTSDGAVALYRLTTGEFQMNAGSYVIVFSELDSGAAYYTPAG